MSLHINPLSVLLDLDNTSYRPAPHTIARINREFRTTLTVKDIVYYGWVFDTLKELYRKHHAKKITDVEITRTYFGNEIIRQAPPMPGMQELVAEIVSMGVKVNACTAREEAFYKDATYDRIGSDYPQITNIYMRTQGYDNSFEFKRDIVAMTNPILVIDDYAEVLIGLANVSPASTYFALVDSFWNQTLEDENGTLINITYDGERIRRVGDRNNLDVKPYILKKQILKYLRWILG